MSTSQADTLRASIAGLDEATTRYQAAAHDPDLTAALAFVPLAEALFWACSLHEALGKIFREPYIQAYAADSAAPYLRGLRFARNRCTHQLALVADRAHLAPPLRPPLTVGFVFRWRPLSELPTPDPGHQNGMAEYGDLLAGDTAESTLRRVSAWLHVAAELFLDL